MGLLNWFKRRKKTKEVPPAVQEEKPSPITVKPETEARGKRVEEKPKSKRRKKKKAE